ncbi:MAG: hypothetical protein K0U78_17130, partial [Actinomycetia bacterium]|nr:hypothetical protein [Actinomycetes bacterium]
MDLTTTSLTDVYTVPAATESVVSTIVIANRSATATTYSIAVRTEGDAISNKHYIASGVALGANNSTTLTLGITVEATDVISVSAGDANAVSVNLFG